ncbi:MAG: exodeoxyribonuclease VII small subunit [Planctomycetes bacterium]|nr:exodeoxyribonuclease VII small subunit [Planctomycetota bacterium]
MAKSKAATDSDQESPHSFEESLSELQQIVNDLEDGTLGLEESMKRFEQGMALLKNCYRVLEKAEQKIEILTGFDAEGNPQTTPFDASSTAKQSGKTAGRRKRKKPSAPSDDSEEDESDTLF